MKRLLELYNKTSGGHKLLSDTEFKEYSVLRKEEYQNRRTQLLESGYSNVKAKKDDSGDIIGWTGIKECEVLTP